MSNFRPEAAYEELVGRKLAPHQVERWYKIQRVLKIHPDDAVWALIIAFEFYDDSFKATSLSVTRWLKLIAALLVTIVALLIYVILRHSV